MPSEAVSARFQNRAELLLHREVEDLESAPRAEGRRPPSGRRARLPVISDGALEAAERLQQARAAGSASTSSPRSRPELGEQEAARLPATDGADEGSRTAKIDNDPATDWHRRVQRPRRVRAARRPRCAIIAHAPGAWPRRDRPMIAVQTLGRWR